MKDRFCIFVKGNLKVDDSSEEKNGIIAGAGYVGVTIAQDVTFTLNSGNVAQNSGYGIYVNKGG